MNKWTVSSLFAAALFLFAVSPAYGRAIDLKYIDVSNDHWAKNEIMQLDELKLLKGDFDMQYRPDAPLTKGQAALALYSILWAKPSDEPKLYRDVRTNSSDWKAVSTAVESSWLQPETKGYFGFDQPMNRGQLELALQTAFRVKQEDLIALWPMHSERRSIDRLAFYPVLHVKQFLKEGGQPVTRAEFAKVLHRLLVKNGYIEYPKTYTLSRLSKSMNFLPAEKFVNIGSVPFEKHPIYLRSTETFSYKSYEVFDNRFSSDRVYTYRVGKNGAEIKLTVRDFENGDLFLFSEVSNPTDEAISIDILQKEADVAEHRLFRFDRYPLMRDNFDPLLADMTSYPTGVLRMVKTDGAVAERMVGQAYTSRPLALRYDNGEQSVTREFVKESEALSFAVAGSTLLSVHSVTAAPATINDHWYVDSDDRLFASTTDIYKWMRETGQNHKKRNNWYTADGAYNKLAGTTEPMPASKKNYGRTLLMMKEDRALELYHEGKGRYFEDLVYNAFVNLKSFKGNETHWQTEVTSTYLKELYDIHAPFIDTRFNEQIALFYYNTGGELSIPFYREALRNYANLLVTQRRNGNTIRLAHDAYYIADYFPVKQRAKTHTSMNHALGGMNVLLTAYKEFGNEQYLQTARHIQNAITRQKNSWIRSNGDIWYRISPDLEFKGEDYKHLTLEDLIDSYQLWRDIDSKPLAVLKEMIISKAGFLSDNQYGYTPKIKKGLKDIGLSEHLPDGDESTDAL